jgi:hypothetical protein
MDAQIPIHQVNIWNKLLQNMNLVKFEVRTSLPMSFCKTALVVVVIVLILVSVVAVVVGVLW